MIEEGKKFKFINFLVIEHQYLPDDFLNQLIKYLRMMENY